MDNTVEKNMVALGNGITWIYKRSEDPNMRRVTLTVLFLSWAALAVFLSYYHVFWRDEVRALSLALQGETLVEMLKSIHGEGHPALWYLALRGVHWVVDSPQALNYTALLIAATAVGILLTRSPFQPHVVALFLFGGIAAFEFSVMTRNYGVSMLFLFLFAAIYSKKRERGYSLGAILFLLANCNAHSAILVAVLIGFWFLDLAIEKKSLRLALSKNFLINAGIAISGIALCFLTIFPTFNDGAVLSPHAGNKTILALRAVFNPSEFFPNLLPLNDTVSFLSKSSITAWIPAWAVSIVFSAILFGSTLGLIRRPAAFLAALIALIGLSVFFAFVYPGGYRHQALWVIFLLTMYWITGIEKESPSDVKSPVPNQGTPVLQTGSIILCFLLLLQVPRTALEIARVGGYGGPLSQSAELAKLINSDPRLRKATIMADPDYLVEALPYYLTNPTYLVREQRFGNVVRFTKNARLQIGLDVILKDALKVKAMTGRPVVVLLSQKLDDISSAVAVHEGYNWELNITPLQAKTFTDSARLIARSVPTQSKETYDVYLID
jgi:hypothetical protein